MTVRNWLTKLLQRSNKVEQVFYVSERDKGDYNNLHVHMLIGTNTDMTYQEVKYGMGNVSVGDYQPIYETATNTRAPRNQICGMRSDIEDGQNSAQSCLTSCRRSI